MKGFFKYIVTLLIFVLIGVGAKAATYYSITNGNWNSNTTWSTSSGGGAVSSGVYPKAGDIVYIERGFTVTMNANSACSNLNLVSTTASILYTGAFTLNVSGTISIGGASSGMNLLSVDNGGIVNVTSNVAFTGGSTSFSSTVRHQLTINTGGTINITGNITNDSGSGSIRSSKILNSGSIVLTGSLAVNTLTNNSGSTFNYNGSSQTVKATNYGNLILSGSGTPVISSTSTTITISNDFTVGAGVNYSIRRTFTVSGNTNISGNITFNTSSSRTITFSGNVTLNSGAVWNESTTNSFVFGGNFVNNSNTFSNYSTSTHTFNGVSKTLSGSRIDTISNLVISGSITHNNTILASALTLNSGSTLNIGALFTSSGTTSISGTININSSTSTVTFSSDVTLNSGSVWNETAAAPITFAGNFTNNATTFTSSTGVHTFSGSTKNFSGNTQTTIPNLLLSGTYTNNSNLFVTTALSGSGTMTQGLGSQLKIGGTSSINLSATANGNIVNYSGSNQTILSNTYANLTLSGSGTATLQSGTNSVTGILLLSGTVSTTTVANLTIDTLNIYSGTGLTIPSSYTFTAGLTNIAGSIIFSGTGTKTFSSDVTLNSGAVWNESGISTFSFAGNFTNNASTFTTNTGVHTFTGVGKNFSGNSIIAIPNLTFGTGSSYTNNATIDVSTALSATTITQSAIAVLKIGGTSSFTTLSASTTGNTIEYYGSNQTVYSTAYSFLTLSGTATKTINSGTSIGATLNLAPVGSSTKLMIGTGLNITTNALILGGTTIAMGTYGSTTANKTNKLDTYFTSSTGYLTVSTGSVGFVSVDNSTITASTTSVVANGTSTATITVTLLDVNSNPVANKVVSISGNGSSIISTTGGTYTGTSNYSGVVVFNVKDNISESVTYTVVGDGLTLKAKQTVLFTAGGIDHFSISSIGINQTAGTPINGLTFTALDINNNTVTSFNSTVSFSGTAGITGNSGTFYNGVLTNVSIIPLNAGTGKTFIITDVSSAKTGTASFTVAVGTVSLSRSTIAANTTTVLPDGTSKAIITVTLKDSYDNLVSGSLVTLNQEVGGSSVISPTSVTSDVNGVAVFNVSDNTTETITYTPNISTAAVTIGDMINTINIDFTAGAANAVNTTFTTSATTLIANGTSTQTLTIVTKDVDGNSLVIGGSTIVVSKVSGTGSIGTVTDNNNGTYSVVITSPALTGSGVFVATLNGIEIKSGTSSQTQITLNYIPGPATQLSFTTQPSSSTVAGVSFATQPVITIVDANGNTITSGSDATAVVTLNLSTGTGTLAGTLTMSAIAGVADFSGKGLNINYTGNDKVLTASATLNSISRNVSSSSFSITNSTATQLVFTRQPSSTTVAGVTFATQPIITIEDTYGNTITSGSDATAVVTLNLSTGTGTLAGTLTMSAIAGVADFSGKGLNINFTGNDKVLTASATLNSISRNITSSAFSITNSTPTQLVFTRQPSSTTVAGVAFATQPIVTIKDVYGNVVTNSGASISLSLSSGSGVLSGTTTLNAVAGVATFSNLNINLIGNDKVLSASTSGLSTVSINTPISITPAAASKLVYTTQPSASGIQNTILSQQPIIEIQDIFGNKVNSSASVSISITTGSGNLIGQTSVNASGGVVTFTDIAFDTQGTGKIVTVSSSGLTSASSRSISILAAGAFMVNVTTTDVTCSNLGKIYLDITGGVAPFKYDWSDISGALNIKDRVGIIAGTYSVTITDATGASLNSGSVIITGDQTGCTGITVCKSETESVFSADPDPNNTSYNWTVNNPNAHITGDGTASIKINWTAVPVGTYQVCVIANNSCGTSSQTCKTVYVKEPEIALFPDPTCSGSNLNLHAYGAVNYVWNGPNSFSSNLANPILYNATSSTANGTYTLTATDANGCAASGSISTNFSVSELPSIDASNVTGANDCSLLVGSGSINLTSISGGTSPYSFIWSKVGTGSYSSTTQNIDHLTTGSYMVSVKNKEGCSITKSFSVTALSGPSIAIASTSDVTCYNGSNGSISVTPTAGTSLNNSFSYIWTNSTGTYSSTDQNITNLSAGKYSVVLKDGNDCSVSTEAIIVQPTAPLSAEATLTNINCTGATTGAINLNVTGGTYTPSYTFAWTKSGLAGTFSTTQNLTNLSAGTYSVTITDHTCTYANTYTITEPSGALSATSVVTPINCYGGNTGIINLTTTGGTSPYSYSWSKSGDGSFSANIEDLSLLTAGTYNVVITDSKSCTLSPTGIVVTQPVSALSVNTYSITNVNCKGGSDGSITLNITGGTLSYTYAWSNGAITNTINGLNAGTYTATVLDANGCSLVQNYNITEPSLALATSISSSNNVTCYNLSNGLINTTTVGGTTPYTYTWSKVGNPSYSFTNANPLNLSAGTYNLSVIDANGCSSSSSATITQPTSINVSANLTNILCNGANTGAINNTTTGGTGPYSYVWNTGDLTEDLTGISAGTYSVTVSDANACSTVQSYTITQPSALSLSSTFNNLTCYNSNDGNISLTVTGGLAPYNYAWSGSGSFSASTKDLNGLIAGTYSTTVTDANGCTAVLPSTIVVSAPTAITLATPTITNINCFGQTTGAITLSVSGGTGSLTYLWADGLTTQNRTALKAGNYNVAITDINGCNINSGTINITQPSADLNLTIAPSNINCNGSSNGSIDATLLGGTSPYSYQWTKTGDGTFNKTTQDLSLLNVGTYNLVATDANNCTVSGSVVINQPSAISLSMTNTNLSCNGSADGSITLTATGGTAPFTYAWTGPNSFTATTKNISSLSPGIYTVTVTDANGCTATLISAAITQPAAVTVAASIIGNVNCYNGADGSISALASGGTAPFTYSWSNGSIGAAQSSLAAGIYKVIVVDANGCTAKDSLTITQPSQPIKLYGTVTDTRACAGTPSGKIDVTVENATGTLTYAWTGPTTIGNIKSPTGLAAGDYALTVSNALGCTATLNKTVGTSAILVASVSTVDKTCAINPDGSAYAVATGGVAPYKYAWASGDTTQKIKGLNVGTFTVNVTDANGCQSSASGTVGSPVCDVPIAVPDFYVATNGGTISNTISTNDVDTLFAAADLNYQLLSVPSTEQGTITANLDGSFVFTPTPLYNGKVQMTYLLTNPLGLSSRTTINIYVAHITITDTVVNSDCTKGGSINLAPSGGFPGYKYAWTGPGNFVSTSQNVSALSPGTYQVSITDSVGANVTQSYVITDNCAPGISSIYLSGTNSFTYNASAQAPQTYTAHGSTGAVTIVYSGVGSTTYATSTTKPKLPGKYKAVATLAADANNASATSVDFEFTIEKAPLTVSAGNQTVYFGDPITTILKAGTFSITGFVGTDDVSVISGTVSYTTNYTTTTNVSATGITITPVVTGLSALNYSFLPASGIITIKSASTARPLPPTVNNANYIFGSTTIPKKLSSLVVSKPIGAVPAWCNVDSSTCDTVAPAMPIIIGKYIYALKSLDTTNGLLSATYTYDTVIIRPNIPTVKDSTYVLGLLTNPANISLQVTGMTGNTINYFITSVKQSTVPKLPTAVGVFRYTASQIVNAIESDTVGFNVTMLNVNDLIHLRKIVDTGVLQSNSTFNYPFTLVVTNLTKYPFTNIIVTDNLHNSVPITSDFSIVKNSANGGLIANPLFNGSNDINVTNNTSTLAPFAKDTAKFTLNLIPKGYNGSLNNIAYVKADTKWGTITMQSSSETKANETTKSPTTYLVKDLKIYIPEGFSPNHDGVNDKFVIIKPYNITLDLEVFNRWGNVVYKNSSYNNEWDGKGTGNFIGQDLIDGGYYYSLRAVDDKGKVEVFKGFIIIQR